MTCRVTEAFFRRRSFIIAVNSRRRPRRAAAAPRNGRATVRSAAQLENQ